MSLLSGFTQAAARGDYVWIGEVRRAFSEEASVHSLVLRLNEQKDYVFHIPTWESAEERQFAFDYLSASIFNILSIYSASTLTLYCEEGESTELAEDCLVRLSSRPGYNKPMKIARRLSGKRPTLAIQSLKKYVPLPSVPKPTANDSAKRIKAAVECVEHGTYCGIDVGGTDIKLAASLNGKLVAVKEYDWNPSLSPNAVGIKAPVLLLEKLMAACVLNAMHGNMIDLTAALDKDADGETMLAAIELVEERYGSLPIFDALGLSYPDIVIHDRIMGGETPKTVGIRNNPAVDYEQELIELSKLTEELKAYAKTVHAVNDGPMAAFSAFSEMNYGGLSAGEAMIAHSLGTDLGTGWIDDSGKVPAIPLECYDMLVDLGSTEMKKLPPDDLRSLRNENSGMAGARRYLGQAAVYRLMYLAAPERIADYVEEHNGLPAIISKPADQRKACLAHIMELAANGDRTAQNAFRQIGVNLARITEEIEFITHPGTDKRFLFGRFIKNATCFDKICEGFYSVLPEIRLVAADDDMALTPLMRQLAGRDDVTVAQFAQAVSAIYYAEYVEIR